MAPAQQDLLHVLAREHRDHSIVFHGLIDHLEDAAPRHRRRQYGALVLNLAVHLTAETLLVHPLVDAPGTTGRDARRGRERAIDSLRTRLTDAGEALDDPDTLSSALHLASGEAAAHADREELEVFVYARHAATPRQLRAFGRLHTTLRQRLPARYQREGSAPTEPWTDERLHTVIRSWYAEAVPEGGPSSVDHELGDRPDRGGTPAPEPIEARRETDARN